MNYKKGQVAIWVILALVLVGSILLFFFVERRMPEVAKGEFGIESYIDDCVRESIEEALEMMLPQGGFLEPKNFKVYNDTKVEYLCKNSGNFEPCINHHPMLLNEMSLELESYAAPRVEKCFENLKEEIEKRNGEINYGETELSISMAPEKVFVVIDKKVDSTFRDEKRTFERFDVEIISPAHNLGSIALDIANNEAKYCWFASEGYMTLYPRWLIKIKTMSDSTKIYTIRDKNTGEEMNIAIRGCAIPPGMGI